MTRIYVRKWKIQAHQKGPRCCYSQWSFSVALILRLKRKHKQTERRSISTTEQATAAMIPAAVLFLPAYIKHELEVVL
jgi:hypothetical protein